MPSIEGPNYAAPSQHQLFLLPSPPHPPCMTHTCPPLRLRMCTPAYARARLPPQHVHSRPACSQPTSLRRLTEASRIWYVWCDAVVHVLRLQGSSMQSLRIELSINSAAASVRAST